MIVIVDYKPGDVPEMGEGLEKGVVLAFELRSPGTDSMFTNGYLTTPGQGYEADAAIIDEVGFKVTEYID